MNAIHKEGQAIHPQVVGGAEDHYEQRAPAHIKVHITKAHSSSGLTSLRLQSTMPVEVPCDARECFVKLHCLSLAHAHEAVLPGSCTGHGYKMLDPRGKKIPDRWWLN